MLIICKFKSRWYGHIPPAQREDKFYPPAIIRRRRISSPSCITQVSYSAESSWRPLIQTAALRIFRCLISSDTVMPSFSIISFLLSVTSIISPVPIQGRDARWFPVWGFRSPRPTRHIHNRLSVCVRTVPA